MVKIIFAVMVFFSLTSNAILRPLTQKERINQATEIAEGVVIDLKKSEICRDSNFYDEIYEAELIVDTPHKGRFRQGDIVKFSFWKQKERPKFWTGPAGQHHLFLETTAIRVYLKVDEKTGDFVLLEPNGFDQL